MPGNRFFQKYAVENGVFTPCGSELEPNEMRTTDCQLESQAGGCLQYSPILAERLPYLGYFGNRLGFVQNCPHRLE